LKWRIKKVSLIFAAIFIIMSRKRKVIALLFVLLVISVIIIVSCDGIIRYSAKTKLYSDVTAIPANRFGILLGVPKFRSRGGVSLYYTYRVAAAAQLIRNHKISYLLISGDSSRKNFNEPASMREDLIKQGVDSSLIFLDNTGLRTFDSMVRLKETYGEDTVTVISQAFHNERALYIASRIGITAIGYNARDVTGMQDFTTQCREKLARVKVFVDFLTGTRPKVTGDKLRLP